MAKTYTVGLVGEANYQDAIRGLREGERVFLTPEPDNAHDPRAIAARDSNGATIGYIPRDHWVTEALIDQGKGSRAIVQSVEGGDAGRPSLGVVLAVELGEKGAAVGEIRVPQAAAASSTGRKIGIGCAGLLGLAVLLTIIMPKPGTGAGSDQLKPDAASSALGSPLSSKSASAEPATVPAAAPAPEPTNDPGISADEFGRLRTGMSYADAIAVIGGPGELSTESDMAGYRTQMYTWKAEGAFNIGGNANAMFQNGKLVSKAQFGLD